VSKGCCFSADDSPFFIRDGAPFVDVLLEGRRWTTNSRNDHPAFARPGPQGQALSFCSISTSYPNHVGASPEATVVTWLREQDPDLLFVGALTLGELPLAPKHVAGEIGRPVAALDLARVNPDNI